MSKVTIISYAFYAVYWNVFMKAYWIMSCLSSVFHLRGKTGENSCLKQCSLLIIGDSLRLFDVKFLSEELKIAQYN